MRAVVIDLVVLDDDKTSDGGKDGDIVECSVCECTLLLLLCGMCRLDDENALYEEEDGGGVEELW